MMYICSYEIMLKLMSTIRHIFLFIGIVSLSQLAIAQQFNKGGQYRQNEINDIVLLYYAQNFHMRWTSDEIYPYVVHEFTNGEKDWFFPGFIFLELSSNDKRRLFDNYAKRGDGYDGIKADWQWFIDKMFIRGQAFDGLERCIENQKPILGEPPFKHKVIMTIPTPVMNQTNWGKLGNKRMDFRKKNDRLSAVKWFVDNFLTRFNEQHYKNIELEGFYWVNEEIKGNSEVVPAVCDYIHSMGYNMYWIPFASATGRFSWEKFKIDYPYLQSNYSIKAAYEPNRELRVMDLAKEHGMGLEIAVDDNVVVKQDIFAPRVEYVLNTYERNGIFENCALTYYFSKNTIQRILKTRNPRLINIVDRIAYHVQQRNRKGSYLQDYTPSDSTEEQTRRRFHPDDWHF